jgi:MFS family permease
MLGSFVLMLPAVMGQGRAGRLNMYFTGSVALLVIAHLVLPWLAGSVALLSIFLLLFFAPFNVLEALLPTLTSKLAPAHNKGVAIGVYSSVQFFGTFVGAVVGGFAYGRWGLTGVVIVNAGLLVIWLVACFGMRAPVASSRRSYTLSGLGTRDADALATRLSALQGVRQVQVVATENRVDLEVDSTGFDEDNVLHIITAET